MEERIRKAVGEALAQAGAPEVAFTVGRPSDPTHGDYATNAAMAAYGKFKGIMFDAINANPNDLGPRMLSKKQLNAARTSPITDAKNWSNQSELASVLAVKVRELLGDLVADVAVAGKGFVNITLARETVAFAIAEADAKGEEWGRGTANEGQRVLIEYTDPNPFKEMHIGHLMSNVIGEALARQ